MDTQQYTMVYPQESKKILVIDSQTSEINRPVNYKHSLMQQPKTPLKVQIQKRSSSPISNVINFQNYYQLELPVNNDKYVSDLQKFQNKINYYPKQMVKTQNYATDSRITYTTAQQNQRLRGPSQHQVLNSPLIKVIQIKQPLTQMDIKDNSYILLQGQSLEQLLILNNFQNQSEEQNKKMRAVISQNEKLTLELYKLKAMADRQPKLRKQQSLDQTSFTLEQQSKILQLVRDLEDKATKLIMENERLNELITNKYNEADATQETYKVMENSIEDFDDQEQLQLLKQIKSQSQQIQSYQIENSRLPPIRIEDQVAIDQGCQELKDELRNMLKQLGKYKGN